MQTLQADLVALTARSTLLNSKRATCAVALDHAKVARQKELLSGDLENDRAAQTLQSKVDTLVSQLAGFDDALAALATTITGTEDRLAVLRLAAARKAASETLEAHIVDIEKKVEPWLSMTRDLAACTALVANVSFETDQIGHFLQRTAGEVETAVAVSIRNLRTSVAAILVGNEPIPAAWGVTEQKS